MEYVNRSVMPSYLSSTDMGGTSRSAMQDETFQLLMGEVKEIIPPSSDKSLSKRYLEYNVEVQYRNGSGPTSLVTFANCLLLNSLAGVADKEYYTLRSDSSEPKQDETNTTGAKVLLLCVQGNAGTAFIIGGVREDKGPDENDHRYFFEFNGVQQSINKDGELQIRYRGQTKVDGDLHDDADPDAEGSTLIFDKEGSIKLYTKDEKQFIYLNHKDKKLDILADEEWHVKVNKVLSFEAGDEVKIKGDKTCTVEMSDKVYIKSAGVHVGGASDAWLLADTYRKAESQMLKQISTTLQSIMSLITTAASTLTSAAAANAPPMVGGAAAATPFAAAGAALTSAAPMFMQMSTAIETFEAQASTYLSTKNKND